MACGRWSVYRNPSMAQVMGVDTMCEASRPLEMNGVMRTGLLILAYQFANELAPYAVDIGPFARDLGALWLGFVSPSSRFIPPISLFGPPSVGVGPPCSVPCRHTPSFGPSAIAFGPPALRFGRPAFGLGPPAFVFCPPALAFGPPSLSFGRSNLDTNPCGSSKTQVAYACWRGVGGLGRAERGLAGRGDRFGGTCSGLFRAGHGSG